ncbi:hypothetical protein PNC201_18330 (plasmid) [Pseudoalteromonas sp. NC201]|nr:hypothetical protein PNC201_18330 [Pseudoalteromonas sp. NC201]
MLFYFTSSALMLIVMGVAYFVAYFVAAYFAPALRITLKQFVMPFAR